MKARLTVRAKTAPPSLYHLVMDTFYRLDTDTVSVLHLQNASSTGYYYAKEAPQKPDGVPLRSNIFAFMGFVLTPNASWCKKFFAEILRISTKSSPVYWLLGSACSIYALR